MEEGKFALPHAYLKKRPALSEACFGDSLPRARRPHSSFQDTEGLSSCVQANLNRNFRLQLLTKKQSSGLLMRQDG